MAGLPRPLAMASSILWIVSGHKRPWATGDMGDADIDSPTRPSSSSLEIGPTMQIRVDIDPNELVFSLSIFGSFGSLSLCFGNNSSAVLPTLLSQSGRKAEEILGKQRNATQTAANRRVLVLESWRNFILFATALEVFARGRKRMN